MWSVCHTQSASHSNTNWLQMSGHSQNAKWYDSVEECWLRTRKQFTCSSSLLLFTHLNLKYQTVSCFDNIIFLLCKKFLLLIYAIKVHNFN